jgi:hypothetical protein
MVSSCAPRPRAGKASRQNGPLRPLEKEALHPTRSLRHPTALVPHLENSSLTNPFSATLVPVLAELAFSRRLSQVETVDLHTGTDPA